MSASKAADLIKDLADVADDLASLLLDLDRLDKAEVDALILDLSGIVARLEERKDRLEKLRRKEQPALGRPPARPVIRGDFR